MKQNQPTTDYRSNNALYDYV